MKLEMEIDFAKLGEELAKHDFVEVVRCGDCEYWKQIDPCFGECLRFTGEMVIDVNWFCADGDRREE